MEIFIYCYIAFSYIVMMGYVANLYLFSELSVKDKSEMASATALLLFSPFAVPLIIGGIMYKLMRF